MLCSRLHRFQKKVDRNAGNRCRARKQNAASGSLRGYSSTGAAANKFRILSLRYEKGSQYSTKLKKKDAPGRSRAGPPSGASTATSNSSAGRSAPGSNKKTGCGLATTPGDSDK